MIDKNKELGMVGLGRMGGNLVLQALEKGMRVVGLDRNKVPDELLKTHMVVARSFTELKKELRPPRRVFIYIPAGPAVDGVLDEIAATLDKGDILIDGGNSYWGDSIRRYYRLKEKGIRFIDLGTSGGIEGARNGACFMAGGDRDAVALIEPLLLELATPGGYVHAGPAGAGHFTKLVHNGIEFGMLQAIGEGIDLLERYKDKLDVAEVLRSYRHGSVIRSWLIDLMEAAYRAEGGLDKVPPYVDDTGEVNWLVEDAIRMEVPVPVIAQSVMQLFSSRDGKKYWARAIAMMRHGFGGHRYGSDEAVERERKEGRVGGYFEKAA
jgi:6-phosphogluconate dehydrogenase